jgi:hypothetical protein
MPGKFGEIQDIRCRKTVDQEVGGSSPPSCIKISLIIIMLLI